MEQIIDAVINNLSRAGIVQIEVSARHVHLSQKDLNILFGPDARLTPKRDLSQYGQYLAEERVNLIGKKGNKQNVAILGPIRKDTQVELSRSDCIDLGVQAPLRESGDVSGSGEITLEGPCGTLKINEGVIIARNHVHVPCEIAKELHLEDKERVRVRVFTERSIVFENVIIRISDKFRFRMHIDFDEANAAAISGFVLGEIIKNTT